MAPETRARASRLADDQQVETLLRQLQDQQDLGEAERRLLLESLQEAEVVLQKWPSGRSRPRELTLFKAELQCRNGRPEAARHSLQYLMRLHPNDLK